MLGLRERLGALLAVPVEVLVELRTGLGPLAATMPQGPQQRVTSAHISASSKHELAAATLWVCVVGALPGSDLPSVHPRTDSTRASSPRR
jgi:hypothetical protein